MTVISFSELNINEQIKSDEVRVVDENGKMLGVFKIEDALKMAEEKNLDLVEVSPNSKPPVCKIMDYGKYKYLQTKKGKQAKKKQHTVVIKEIQMRPNIDKHDLDIKLRHALEFLEKGYKVKFTIRFLGREIEFKETKGKDLITKIIPVIAEKGILDDEPKNEGNTINFLVSPIKKK